MMLIFNKKFCVTASQWGSKAVVLPIVTATTYEQSAPTVHSGFYYGRSTNPTRQSLEQCLASLEGAEHAFVFASGLAAMSAVVQLLTSGDHILAGDELFVDMTNLEALSSAITDSTRLVCFETPTNPLLKVVDIEAVMARTVKARKADVLIAVDRCTFLSPPVPAAAAVAGRRH
ncbi:hypothetical protein TYRP_017271 [Tyrophagus putrescentiae]|nr:hypothetical protein TYRP_017271 [Tyrophagus putrescentiae]